MRFGGQSWYILVSDPPWHLSGTGRSDNSALRFSVSIRYTYLARVFVYQAVRSSYPPALDPLRTARTKSGFSPSGEPLPLGEFTQTINSIQYTGSDGAVI